jgi:hypothetical protein
MFSDTLTAAWKTVACKNLPKSIFPKNRKNSTSIGVQVICKVTRNTHVPYGCCRTENEHPAFHS